MTLDEVVTKLGKITIDLIFDEDSDSGLLFGSFFSPEAVCSITLASLGTKTSIPFISYHVADGTARAQGLAQSAL